VLLRLVYLGVANVFALLRLLRVSNRDKDAVILALRLYRFIWSAAMDEFWHGTGLRLRKLVVACRCESGPGSCQEAR
jgi:hypothetical protein